MFRQPLRNAKERLRLFLSECGRRARVLRDCLRRQPDRIDRSLRFVPGFRYGYWGREARGLELLKEWLSPEQFAQYDANSYFEVTGCHNGKRYRISHGTSMNIHELDGAGRPRLGWCLRPRSPRRRRRHVSTENCAGDRRAWRAGRGEQIFRVSLILSRRIAERKTKVRSAVRMLIAP
jgi:hypothetical protein